MNTKDYVYAGIIIVLIIIAAWCGKFVGGFVAGFFSSVFLFSTVGKILFKKSEKRIDTAIRLKRMMDNY